MNIKLFGRKVTLYQLILHCILIVLTFEVVFLIGEIRTLKKGGEDFHNRILKQGDSIQVVDLVTLSGLSKKFPDTSRHALSLVFIFHTKCPYCRDNIEKWNYLNERLKGDSIDIVAVSIHKKETTAQYVQQYGLKAVCYNPLDSAFLRIFKPHAVPQTIIISKDFKILRNYSGILSEKDVDSISTIINNIHSQYYRRSL